jgi:hypothetical protein
LDYECPECGSDLPADARQCPGCGLEFETDADEDGFSDEEDATSGEGAGEDEATEVAPVPEAAPAEPAAKEDTSAAEEAEAPPPGATERRLFMGVLSAVGLTSLVLAILAAVGTLLIMHWDVWIGGAAKESIGGRQWLLIYSGMAGIVVCGVGSIADVLRRRT